MADVKTFRVLMACTGNICRSPSAEGVLRHMLDEAGLSDWIEVDSAGTMDWHVGDSPSHLAVVAAEKRGYDFTGIVARALRASDYQDFDLILAMDEGHRDFLTNNRPASAKGSIAMFLDAAPEIGRIDVPDPYYGGEAEYEYSLDLIEAGCRGWVARLTESA